MYKSFRKSIQITALSALTTAGAHADFLGTLTDTVNKVQQTVNSTQQAVGSAQQTVNNTQNTVQQAQQIPQQVIPQQQQYPQQQYPQQTPPLQTMPQQQMPPPVTPQNQPVAGQNGVVIDERYLSAREATVKEQRERAGRAVRYPYSGMQFAKDELALQNQMGAEMNQIYQRYPTNQNDPQCVAEIHAATARHYDRLEQLYRNVQAGRYDSLVTQGGINAQPAQPPQIATAVQPRASNDIQITLGIKLGMRVAEVRNLLATTGYKLINGPKEGYLQAYSVFQNDGQHPRDFRLNIHAYPTAAKSSALTEQDLVVLVLTGARDYGYANKNAPTLDTAISYYQQTYGPIYSLHDGMVDFRPELSFKSNYSIANVESPPPTITDQASPSMMCHRALLTLMQYAPLNNAGNRPPPQAQLQDTYSHYGPQFAATSKQCSRIMEAGFFSSGATKRDSPLQSIVFTYGDVYRLEEVFNAIANTKTEGPGNSKIALAL